MSEQTVASVALTLSESGRKYGYPECCIDHFVLIVVPAIGRYDPWEDEIVDMAIPYSDGHILCPECRERALRSALGSRDD